MVKNRIIRVLLAKIGLDGHDRGVKIIGKALQNVGMEVIYTGIYQQPEAVVNTAVQEDVDVIGISSLASGHLILLPKLVKLLREKGEHKKIVIVGGVIPEIDIPILKEAGVAAVFLPGTKTSAVVEFIYKSLQKKGGKDKPR